MCKFRFLTNFEKSIISTMQFQDFGSLIQYIRINKVGMVIDLWYRVLQNCCTENIFRYRYNRYFEPYILRSYANYDSIFIQFREQKSRKRIEKRTAFCILSEICLSILSSKLFRFHNIVSDKR